ARILAHGLPLQRRAYPRDRLVEIVRVELDADEVDAELRRGDGAAAEPEKRIHRGADTLESMELEALPGQTRGEGRRMRTVLVAALDRLVRDEPCVPAATKVAGTGAPPCDIRRILVGNADRGASETGGACRWEGEE